MRPILHHALAITVTATLLAAFQGEARAQDDQPPPPTEQPPPARYERPDSVAMSANRGLNVGIGPTLLMPMRAGGPFGGGLTLDGRYGIKAGPLVLAPGALLAGYVISERLIGVPMGTFRITVPIGPLAPFIVGGMGYGWISNPSESGLAYLAGGGLMVHLGRIVAIGLEATYQTISDTEFHSVALGPAIIFGG